MYAFSLLILAGTCIGFFSFLAMKTVCIVILVDTSSIAVSLVELWSILKGENKE